MRVACFRHFGYFLRSYEPGVLPITPSRYPSSRNKNLHSNISGRRYGTTSTTRTKGLKDEVKNLHLVQNTSLINGKWVNRTERTYQVENPATGDVVTSVEWHGASEAVHAIETAAASWKEWKQTTATHRANIIWKWRELLLKNRQDIESIMILESGKPRLEASAEFQAGLASLDWFAAECARMNGQLLQPSSAKKRHMTLLQPVGVVGAITPWNFPFSMITRKVAPALAAGCCIVLKPSEQTPVTAFAIAHLAQEAGLPPGVLNVVSGDAAAIGKQLATHPEVRKLTFTGSTQVGKLLLHLAADSIKKVSMELGGNAPYIVFEDADIEQAAEAAIASGLRNAGQTCICANRILVQAPIYDKFLDVISDRMCTIRVGPGMDPGTNMGPCINSQRVEVAKELVEDATSLGARLLLGGYKPENLPQGGHFFSPTLLADVTANMRIFKQESFAPIIPVTKFKKEKEAVDLANATEHGLAAYCFTNDLSRAFRVAEDLESGMVGVNEVAIVAENAPFGGVKQSGLGREHGSSGILEFVEEKHICIGLSSTR